MTSSDTAGINKEKLLASFDPETGCTTSLIREGDPYGMNWVLPDSDWGRPEHFRLTGTSTDADGLFSADYVSEQDSSIRLTVTKSVTDGVYTEDYMFSNDGEHEFFMGPEKIGIHYPLNCLFRRTPEVYHTACITHLWCGGSVCYMDSLTAAGDPIHLVGILTSGSVDDYSIDYDLSRVRIGADFRGAFVLHPAETVLHPGAAMHLTFVFRFTEESPGQLLLKQDGAILPEADRYSLFLGEKTECRVLCHDRDADISIVCDGEIVPYKVFDDGVRFTCRADRCGEKRYVIRSGGRETFLRLNILEPLDTILEKRAHFIAEKQQYREPGSRLYGAYLIYDRASDKQYFDAVFRDHNACRERIGMGVITALALQKHYDEALMESLRLHRAFVEREMFDTETGCVYDSEGKNGSIDRPFDYPWVSVYYLEWYRLTGETACLLYAARALFAYYEHGGMEFEAQCIEAYDIIRALGKECLDAEAQKLTSLFIGHADRIVGTGINTKMSECSVCNEHPDGKINYLSQAYMLTGDRRYLDAAQERLPEAAAFFGDQPDYRLNGIPVRYWDNYWFGKLRSYGDVFPQYWSILSGTMLCRYTEADPERRTDALRRTILNNLTGNLCVFAPDGFASCSYLYPYKITQWVPDGVDTNPYMRPQITYGHQYDDFANDQDWALYYAVRCCMKIL